MVNVVLDVDVSGVIAVGNSVIIDIGVVVDNFHVVNCTNSQYILVVVTADCRRNGGAATPAEQRRRHMAGTIGCHVEILVSIVVVGRGHAVDVAISWSRRGKDARSKEMRAAAVVTEELQSIETRSG